MQPTSIQALRRNRFGGTSTVISAFWVAICAAAPEFLWHGLHVGFGHFTRTDLLSALLIGVILAFFVEPLMRRIDDLLRRARHRETREPQSALFTASLSLSFAIASVGVHHALTAFVSDGDPEHMAGAPASLPAALSLALEWGIVPWAITLAWLSVQWHWLKVPMGVLAAASPAVAGWLFSWSWLQITTTAIPCLLILSLGYRSIIRWSERFTFARCAPSVALVAGIWLTIALLIDTFLRLYELPQLRLYGSVADFWMDARFYLGWILGLILVPPPYDEGPQTAI